MGNRFLALSRWVLIVALLVGLSGETCNAKDDGYPYDWASASLSDMLSTPVFYIKCSNPVNSSLYVDTAPCLNINASSLVQQKTYSYMTVGVMKVGDLNEGCSAEWVALALFNYSKAYNTSYESIHSALMYGFDLHFWLDDEEICKHKWRKYHTCYPHTIPVCTSA
ncbi:rust resistance kinase Lr10 [Prunus yedoensis var. nudiflora]|uniref:Rust resistance kinase Lr10 n=1 Tax=Prunus yedoensis var. nudiflora TaxID=2094558 RepID=A0A314YPQ3_PRUYE|nr:rust resistance kinase Lr10 [Prunus yedoensis var. nudiflora]